MTKITRNSFEKQSLFQWLLTIRDPRVSAHCTYPLINIIFIVFFALVCGVTIWKGMVQFAHMLIVG